MAGADSYVLELDRLNTCVNGGWCSDVGVYNVTENIPGTRQRLAVPGGSYLRWRVWAVAANRRSLGSEWIMFNIPAAPTAPAGALPRRADPEYSPEARAAGLEGALTVGYQIDTAGIPRFMRVIQGLGLGLDEKAIEAVSKWRFGPSAGIRTESSELRFNLGKPSGWHVRHTAYTVIRRGRQAEVTTKPVMSNYVRPADAACPAGQRTLVEVNFHLDRKGVPRDIRLLPSTADASIRQSVEAWRFRPARADGDDREADAAFTLECNGYAPEARPAFAGGGTTPPVMLSKVEPEYSEAARRTHLQGNVILLVLLDQDGFVTNITVKQGLEPDLDMNAMEAVRQWRFKPAEKGGQPVPFSATVEVNFRLL